MGPTTDMVVNIIPCERIGFARWFEVGRRPADLVSAVEALTALYQNPAERRPLRLVAQRADGEIVAKLGGYITRGGRLAFWSVYYATPLDELRRRQLARRLVRACLDLAVADPTVRYVETRPGHDSPDLPFLLDALRDEGMRLIAEHHVYQWSEKMRIANKARPPVTGLRIVPYEEANRGLLGELFDRVKKVTLDRAERQSLASTQDTLDELAQQSAEVASTGLWSLAFLADNPVGFVLCGGEPPDGLVLELGVVPEARRRGIGSRLLDAALHALTARGVETAEALIDDANTPSIALHQACGFVRLQGEFYTWRYDAKPAAKG